MKNTSVKWYLLSTSVFLLIIVPQLLTDGMFMDGLIYASIARNLAEGIGSFSDLKCMISIYMRNYSK